MSARCAGIEDDGCAHQPIPLGLHVRGGRVDRCVGFGTLINRE